MLNRIGVRYAGLSIGAIVVGTCLGLLALGGCERKERVVDVKTPIGDVKVDKNVDNGDVDVKVDRE